MSTQAMEEVVAHYLDELRRGRDAFFGLTNFDSSIVPELIAAYGVEKEGWIRAFLVRVIWEYRLPETLDFFEEALHDNYSEAWQESLNGFCTIGTQRSLDILNSERAHLFSEKGKAAKVRMEWIEEAIEQIMTAMASNSSN